MGPSARFRIIVAIVLALVGALVSGLLLLQHHGEGDAASALCGDAQTSGCAEVARSRYSAVAGVPLAAAGLLFYLAIAAGLLLATQAPDDVRDAVALVALAATLVALAIDVVLLGLQAVAIKAFCRLCLATYAINGGLLGALVPARHAFAAARPAMGKTEGRSTLAGWLVAAFALAGAVSAADLALRARAAGRAAGLLGAPTATAPAAPPAASAPAVDTSPAVTPVVPAPAPTSSDAGRWEAEAKRLQQILDDPQKLDQYFTDKAAREFREARVESLDLANVPSKGAAGAPVRVVEFSDFLCPFCRNLAGALGTFVPQSGNRVSVFYKNYPLDQSCSPKLKATTHPGACWLALGAICAQEQGKFWAYHDKVFGSNLQNPGAPDVARLAREAGLDTVAIDQCLQAPGTKAKLTAQIEEGQRVGVQATPTVFINGKKLPRINDFIQVVDKEAQAKGFPPLQPGPVR